MNIVPVLDRILVRPIPDPDISKGGIILAPAEKRKPDEGLVLAVGPGRFDPKLGAKKPLMIKPGDTIIYHGAYVGVEVNADGEKLLMMKEDDVLGVVE